MLGIPLLGMCDIQSLLLGNSKVVEKVSVSSGSLWFISGWYICLNLYLLGLGSPLLGKSDIPGLLLGNRLVSRKF